MAELHYVPNLRAQQLAGKRTRTLGLITTDLRAETCSASLITRETV
jgi:DNA-binding LacI/PurR family transcriptional regulator